MKLFRKPKSKFYWYDFTVRGRRYRGSTQETKAARSITVASLKLAEVMEGTDPLPTKPFALGEFSNRFIGWVDDARLEGKTRTYYRNGWRLLKATAVVDMRLDEITSGNASQSRGVELIVRAPKIRLMKEHGRSLRLDDDTERKLLAAALGCKWRKKTDDLCRDIIILMRDTGMRNQRELYQMRIENLDWENRLIFVPDSKTPEGRRLVPMSRRVFDILRERCGTRREGWVFPSARSESGHIRSIDRLFRQARMAAGLPRDLVLYCARHDYGTRVLMRTGNLAAVMKTMGHRDVKTAMHYQHPELEIVRAALDYNAGAKGAEIRCSGEKVTAHSPTHRKTAISASC